MIRNLYANTHLPHNPTHCVSYSRLSPFIPRVFVLIWRTIYTHFHEIRLEPYHDITRLDIQNNTVLPFVLALPWFNVLKTRPFFSLKQSISQFGNKLLGSPFPFGFFTTESLVRPPEFRNDELICVCCLLSVRGIVGKQNAVFPLYTCVCFLAWVCDRVCDSEGLIAHSVTRSRCSPDLHISLFPPSLILPKTPCWRVLIHSVFCFASLLAAQIHEYIICILEVWRAPFTHSVIAIKRVPDRRWRIKSR